MVRWLVLIGLLTGFWMKGVELGRAGFSKPFSTAPTTEVHTMDGADPFPH